MWSLFQKRANEDSSGIFDYASETGEALAPLKFSNNKTQEDVVREILEAIEAGNKIIFIRGVCGTGKSAIALNLARHFKKTSVVVPIKSLQAQYEHDYTKEKFILKKDGKPMKISIIKGRRNFSCPFVGGNCNADDLPCTIELREKNMEQIKKYIEKNPFVDKFDFSSVVDVRRMSVAPACEYWSPLLPSNVESKVLKDSKKIKYMSVCGKEFALFQRKKGCGYYDQYETYADSDVLVFNSAKYVVEIAIGRKPKTDLDVIDECDEFLDSFASEEKINLNRLLMALSNLFPDNREDRNAVKQMIYKINNLVLDFSDDMKEIKKLEQTNLIELFQDILASPYIAEDEEANYYNRVFEICKSFEHLIKDTYVTFEQVENEKKEITTYVSLVSINLAQKFKDIIDANNVLVLMSGTLHSSQVLRDIFGLEDFKIIDAETVTPGTITKYRTGLEKNCKYSNFKSGLVSREDYLKALQTCVLNAKPPTLVHISAFSDLPTELEKAEYNLTELISREKLSNLQKSDPNNKQVNKFKAGDIDLLFTTKCSRGVDFPGEKCNSVVLTKYPYPNTQSLFWKILKQQQPDKFLEFYLDKANRELLQKIYRALRFKEDHVILLSPDVRVLDARVK